VRIVAGRHRGRALEAPPGRDVRPTADRTREALFNLLELGRAAADGSAVAGAIVLDAFAGSGALALEALSRGAERATALERDPSVARTIRDNAARLDETARLTVVVADALRPPAARAAATLVLLDPPYGEDLAPKALMALDRAGWIAPGAVVAVETGSKETLEPPAGFDPIDRRTYGRAAITLLRRD